MKGVYYIMRTHSGFNGVQSIGITSDKEIVNRYLRRKIRDFELIAKKTEIDIEKVKQYAEEFYSKLEDENEENEDGNNEGTTNNDKKPTKKELVLEQLRMGITKPSEIAKNTGLDTNIISKYKTIYYAENADKQRNSKKDKNDNKNKKTNAKKMLYSLLDKGLTDTKELMEITGLSSSAIYNYKYQRKQMGDTVDSEIKTEESYVNEECETNTVESSLNETDNVIADTEVGNTKNKEQEINDTELNIETKATITGRYGTYEGNSKQIKVSMQVTDRYMEISDFEKICKEMNAVLEAIKKV